MFGKFDGLNNIQTLYSIIGALKAFIFRLKYDILQSIETGKKNKEPESIK